MAMFTTQRDMSLVRKLNRELMGNIITQQCSVYWLSMEWMMAKPATLQIKLVSTADTGFYYVTKKNPRTKPEKLELKKYDPKARKHVLFREAKIK